MSNKDIGVLIEYFDNKLGALAEVVCEMRKNMVTKQQFEEELAPIKSDVKVIKAVAKDISQQQKNHEKRIAKLEDKGGRG